MNITCSTEAIGEFYGVFQAFLVSSAPSFFMLLTKLDTLISDF